MADVIAEPGASGLIAAVMGSMLDAVIAIDRHGVVVAWNHVATDTFGWSVSEAVGCPLAGLIIPARHRDNHERGMHRYQTTGVARVVGDRKSVV